MRLAIQLFEEALAQFDPENSPVYYSKIKNNWGITYWNLADCQDKKQVKIQYLQNALEAFEEVLSYISPDIRQGEFRKVEMNYKKVKEELGKLLM